MTQKEAAISRSRTLGAWLLCCVLAGCVFVGYALTSRAVGRGEYVMPLDDVYIHFQYARQMANGQPFVYNPGQPATSGATSFLYPFVLAAGYAIGFQGLNLGIWAMGIGALALVFSAWLIYLLACAYRAPYPLVLFAIILFALTGAMSWHYMSGMETGLMIMLTLLTLLQVVRQDARGIGIAGALLTLMRPEGGILAIIASVAAFTTLRRELKSDRSQFPQTMWLLLPLLALAVQPIVNLIFTGSAVATGNQAKSIFGTIPFYWNDVSQRVLENFAQMWLEFTTSISPREGLYLPHLPIFVLIGMGVLLVRRQSRSVGLMVVGWLLAGTAAISTLDTAFWHFKRYQMPLMALFFPLAIWGIAWLWQFLSRQKSLLLSWRLVGFSIFGAFIVINTLWTWGSFLRNYAVNVNYVYLQPLQMARWLDANTPVDATVAVHDVGMMRYIGNRTTIDMVGLTTPGAADPWRNGPGSVAEFLIDVRPDYVAAYTDARGLNYLAETGLYNYGVALAEFRVVLDDRVNVALGGSVQGIYRPDWSGVVEASHMQQPQPLQYVQGLELVDSINVGNLQSERDHIYEWESSTEFVGFISEVRQFDYVSCIMSEDSCNIMDAGRNMTQYESFVLSTRPNEDLVLVTRLHPTHHGTYDLYVNGNFIDTNWIPDMPGRWLEEAFLVDAQYITSEHTQIEIIPHVEQSYYAPYYHWAWQGEYRASVESFSGSIGVAYGETFNTFNVEVNSVRFLQDEIYLGVGFRVYGLPQGDYKLFAHVYENISAPPVAQIDTYPLLSELPGNMLMGSILLDIIVDVHHLVPGRYQVAIGMYDAVTLENIHPNSGGDSLGRVFIGIVEVT